MIKPTMHGNILHLPVKYLLKKFKKDSGYTEAKKLHPPGELYRHADFDSDAYLCETINKICNAMSESSFEFPNPVNVHAAFREVAPFMIKSDRNGGDFIFEWLKRPYAELLDENNSFEMSNTENRIRILKLIVLVSPNAVLRIKMEDY